MNDFITWEMFATYTTFVGLVYLVVEFTKELPYIVKIHTKYYSAIVAFLLMLAVVLHDGSFAYWDIVLYILTAMSVSLGANGLSDFTGGKNE